MIRDFTPADYEALAELHNAIYPDYPETAEDFRRQDRLREAKYVHRRYVWETDGRLLAFGVYEQSPWNFHPRKMNLELAVHPDARGRGIGGAFYEHLRQAVADLDLVELHTMTRVDWEPSLRFAHKRGFSEGMRMEESRCDIAGFEAGAYAQDLARVEAQGIVMATWPELAGDPASERRFYALAQQLLADMPRREPHVKPPFELWRERILAGPRFLPEICVFALDGEEFIGLSNFWSTEIPGRVGTGLTGVLDAYRRRGIATALKVRALAAAREAGFKDTSTWNDATNAGMLGINRRLGFKPHTAWLELDCPLELSSEASREKEAVKGK